MTLSEYFFDNEFIKITLDGEDKAFFTKWYGQIFLFDFFAKVITLICIAIYFKEVYDLTSAIEKDSYKAVL